MATPQHTYCVSTPQLSDCASPGDRAFFLRDSTEAWACVAQENPSKPKGTLSSDFVTLLLATTGETLLESAVPVRRGACGEHQTKTP